MRTPEELSALNAQVQAVRAGAGTFRSFAVFDEPLDCIRVVTRDCSVNEIRVDEHLTLLEANYPTSGKPECVGFTIKGVAYICETAGIEPTAPWKIADFLNAVVTQSKPHVGFMVKAILQPIVDAKEIDDVDRLAAV